MRTLLSYLLVLSPLVMSACATIVKSERIPVRFVGGLHEGDTQINLPDGQYNIKNGQTTVLVSRSKEDIPISVTCNQETREGIIQTKYDAVAGVLGNIVFGGLIGMSIDAYNNKTYDPPAIYNLSPLCLQRDNPVAEIPEADDKSRSPSSIPSRNSNK